MSLPEQRTKASRFPLIFFNRQWWWATILVILGVAFLARLGLWQLDRLEQRRAYNTEMARQLAAPPFSLTGEALPGEPAEWRHRQVSVAGEFDFSQQIVLLAQNYQGQPGVHLVAPLRIAGSDKAVLVDRGWIPAREARAGQLARFDEPGVLVVTGTLQTTQALPRAANQPAQAMPATPQPEWYRVDIPAIQAQLPYEILPLYVQQAPSEGIGTEPPYRVASEVVLSEGSHLGYAIQWFTFALMLAVGYFFFVLQPSTSIREEDN
jgi:surfeit locus 1 family protein